LKCDTLLFIGWIHDLSAPDPLGLLTAFGLFDYDVGAVPIIGGILLMINIGVWPILMGLSMFLQQKLNPQPVDKSSSKNIYVPSSCLYFCPGRFCCWIS